MNRVTLVIDGKERSTLNVGGSEFFAANLSATNLVKMPFSSIVNGVISAGFIAKIASDAKVRVYLRVGTVGTSVNIDENVVSGITPEIYCATIGIGVHNIYYRDGMNNSIYGTLTMKTDGITVAFDKESVKYVGGFFVLGAQLT